MNFGIDIDGTITKYPEFFIEFGKAMKNRGHNIYIITGLGEDGLIQRLKQYTWFNDHSWYDTIITTKYYNQEECNLIGIELNNEKIVGRFKQRICKELNIDIIFDDKAQIHREFGNIPIFEVK